MAKTGGLGDVGAALPAALRQIGVDVRLLLPGYSEALERTTGKTRLMSLGGLPAVGNVDLIAASMPDSDVPVLLVHSPQLYHRAGLYQDVNGQDWSDNAIRFGVFSHVAARLAGGAHAPWSPDVLHAHDWHVGLAPALLARGRGARAATLFTIHNLAFQGLFSPDVLAILGIPPHVFTPDGVEFYGQLSFLKAGIRFADRVTTVSPSYAREILTPEFGCGLDGLLRARASDLVGVLNGVDYGLWGPHLAAEAMERYDASDLSGKARCKLALQRHMGLAEMLDAPLIAFVSRLTEQKMADLLADVVPTVTALGAQLVVVGQGERWIEDRLRLFTDAYPARVAVRIGYAEDLARRVLAGADLLLAPARFEPCGLIQMYAMRYGTLPVVRRVGGLGDTVRDLVRLELAASDEATGFVFERATAHDLGRAVERACRVYQAPALWRRMQARAMAQDFGWVRSAREYVGIYKAIAPRLRRSLSEQRRSAG